MTTQDNSSPSHLSRRPFLVTSAGLAATLIAPKVWAIDGLAEESRRYRFQESRHPESAVSVTRVTPGDGFYVFTYYDVCPFSPSQRFLAVSRLPFQDRMPVLGETADVCIIDLKEQSIRTVYSTKCWGFQTGTNVQWGADDRYVFTNDVIDEEAVCVRVDLESGAVKALAGPMYNIAPDASCVISFPLELFDVTQLGYGSPPSKAGQYRTLPRGAANNQGLWRTDLKTNERTLLVSLADLAERLPEPPPRDDGTFYLWHSKFNRQGTRIMQVLRCLFPGESGIRNAFVFTLAADGSDIYYTPCFPVWDQMGGHPNWHPDGKHLIRNLTPHGDKERFCKVSYDGKTLTVLSEEFKGGGHPTIEPTERFVLTDVYPPQARDNVIVRLYGLNGGKSIDVCRIKTIHRGNLKDRVFRLDGHPVWSRDYQKVCFQAAPERRRQIYMADINGLINA